MPSTTARKMMLRRCGSTSGGSAAGAAGATATPGGRVTVPPRVCCVQATSMSGLPNQASIDTARGCHTAISQHLVVQFRPCRLGYRLDDPVAGGVRVSSLSSLVLLAIFVVCAAVIWIAGIKLSDTTDVLAERWHLGSALGGVIMLAVAT